MYLDLVLEHWKSSLFQVNIQMRQTDRQTDTTDRQNRQTDRQAGRQADRQTDRQHTDIKACKETF